MTYCTCVLNSNPCLCFVAPGLTVASYLVFWPLLTLSCFHLWKSSSVRGSSCFLQGCITSLSLCAHRPALLLLHCPSTILLLTPRFSPSKLQQVLTTLESLPNSCRQQLCQLWSSSLLHTLLILPILRESLSSGPEFRAICPQDVVVPVWHLPWCLPLELQCVNLGVKVAEQGF